jgi:hypothetical protein
MAWTIRSRYEWNRQYKASAWDTKFYYWNVYTYRNIGKTTTKLLKTILKQQVCLRRNSCLCLSKFVSRLTAIITHKTAALFPDKIEKKFFNLINHFAKFKFAKICCLGTSRRELVVCSSRRSWTPKIKTLEKIKNMDFNFTNQYLKKLNLRKYYRKM